MADKAQQESSYIVSYDGLPMSAIRELVVEIQPVSWRASVAEVLSVFEAQSQLAVLPVVDDELQYAGVLSRWHFFKALTSLDKQCRIIDLQNLKSDIFFAPLTLDTELNVAQAVSAFLTAGPKMIIEALPVLDGSGRVLGVVTIVELIRYLVESQKQLMMTAQQLDGSLAEITAVAAIVQRKMLRPKSFAVPGVRGVLDLEALPHGGGDFYDYYLVDNRWLMMLVGELSITGPLAALAMSFVKIDIDCLEIDKEKDPARLLARLNRLFLGEMPLCLSMSMFAACLDTQTGKLRYASAGQQYPYLYRVLSEHLEKLELEGPSLGISAHSEYVQVRAEMEVGDRLFLCTNALVKQSNAQGECFGEQRLEQLLCRNGREEIAQIGTDVRVHLCSYTGRVHVDDVAIFIVERDESHTEPVKFDVLSHTQFELTKILDSFYRANPRSVPGNIVRQNMVLLARKNFSDLIPDLAMQGIRRVLLRHHSISQQLGWDNLLNQHWQLKNNDLETLFPQPDWSRSFRLTHSRDKFLIIQEIEEWFQCLPVFDAARLDVVVLLLDELIENGLYAAPRDAKGRALYLKGEERSLAEDEELLLTLAFKDNILVLSLVDSWGTFTPTVFLNRLVNHVKGIGLESGKGGGGVYLMWRMADYLQIRVFPNRKTQISAFLDLSESFMPDIDKGFQFFYHSELHEAINHDAISIANSA